MENISKKQQLSSLLRPYRHWLIAAQGVLLIGVFGTGVLVHRALTPKPEKEPTPVSTEAHDHDHADDSSSVWICSMHPAIRREEPGSCPICLMDLVPEESGSGRYLRQLTVDREARALMEIQTTPVQRRYVTAEVRMVGKVDFDETRMRHITARVPGRLDRLFVDYTGVRVSKGDHMASIYSPDLYVAQQELIDSLKFQRERREKNPVFSERINPVESAREKLRLWELTDEQIKEIENREKPTDHMTLYSPMGGIVINRNRQEGDYVKIGERIYTVADLNHVWIKLDAYESDLVWLRYGQEVEFTSEAYPGETFKGRIAFIDPVLNEKTRTVKVRVNVDNPAGKLKPEMFVRGVVQANIADGGRVVDPSLAGKWISPMHPEIVKDEPGTCDICGMPLVRVESLGYLPVGGKNQQEPLVIPASAVLPTGTRAVVYVEMPQMNRGIEAAYEFLAEQIEKEDLENIRSGFSTLHKLLSRPNQSLSTTYERKLWMTLAGHVAAFAEQGHEATTSNAAEALFNELTKAMEELRDHFAIPDKPSFLGREIVLGPRAGKDYLVRSGLVEGEHVVTHGSFKIDSALQIKAKPSMMSSQGGGSGAGGHQHHHGPQADAEHQAPQEKRKPIPRSFYVQVDELSSAEKVIGYALHEQEIKKVHAAFTAFGHVLQKTNGKALSGNTKLLWRELRMLMNNDVVEGSDATDLIVAEKQYRNLVGRMRRLLGEIGPPPQGQLAKRLEVPAEFEEQVGLLWNAYLSLQLALAGDDLTAARQSGEGFQKILASVNDQVLSADAKRVWTKERTNLEKILHTMQGNEDLNSLRENFVPLSGEIEVLVISFGVGDAGPVYQHHCPMAFDNKGASWLQKDDQTQNPYFGAAMLKCADHVEKISMDNSARPKGGHSHE